MSTFRNPVGPQPSKVYWRRRLIFGLGLLAVVIVIILIVSRPGGAPPTGTKAPTPLPSASATTSPPSGAAGAACDPAKVTIDPITDATSYEAGQNPALSFTLKSSLTAACTFAAGSDVQEFRITSGDELIWSSKDCQTDQVAAITTLQPGVPKQGPSITWDRTRSSADTCATAGDPVVAGGASYHLEVVVGEVTSKMTKQFLLY